MFWKCDRDVRSNNMNKITISSRHKVISKCKVTYIYLLLPKFTLDTRISDVNCELHNTRSKNGELQKFNKMTKHICMHVNVEKFDV